MVYAGLPAQSGPPLTEFELSVGERMVLQFKRRPQITAVAELVWNALDANASEVDVELRRSSRQAITEVVVSDNGHGMTPERARTAFQAHGTTWKAARTHTEGGERILHGRNGEGRLFAFALGDQLTWESAAWESMDFADPCISVPQGEPLSGLERDDTAANLTAKLVLPPGLPARARHVRRQTARPQRHHRGRTSRPGAGLA